VGTLDINSHPAISISVSKSLKKSERNVFAAFTTTTICTLESSLAKSGMMSQRSRLAGPTSSLLSLSRMQISGMVSTKHQIFATLIVS